jgi:hypothetical protein
VDKLQVAITPTPMMSIRIANGADLSCTTEVKAFQWWTQGHTFQIDAKIIDIGAYDLVLGMDWLELHKPMTCDWLKKWIEFPYKNSVVRLQGIVPPQPAELQEVFVEQVIKWNKGNDLWDVVQIEPAEKQSSMTDQYLVNGIPV